MRKIMLSEITSNMKLGKSIYHYNTLLLREGTSELDRFIDSLTLLGITSIYIEDAISEDIEIPDAISEETRFKCKDALQDTFNRFQRDGSFDLTRISESTNQLIEEILSRPDVLISLNDIGTTDDSTLVHSVNTTVLAILLGQQLNLSLTELKRLAEGTILHDIGKIVLDSAILYKPTSLSDDEFEHIKQHPVLGYKILKENPLLTELSRLISLQHHERLDGSGYPCGLTSNDIHPFAKIVAIVDMFDALTAERCYRKSISNHAAINLLMKNSEDKIDPEFLRLFIRNIAIYPNGSIVHLSDGTRGIVKSQNRSIPFRPVVRVIDDRNNLPVHLYDLDLSATLNVTITD